MPDIKITVLGVAYHRNGIFGEGFHVVSFKNDDQTMVGIVFEESHYVAVLDVNLLAAGTITWENAWRGDDFERPLREAIELYDNQEIA